VKFVTLLIALIFIAEELRRFLKAVGLVRAAGRNDDVSVRARPLMFMFLFTWALPLSFVPLNAASLPVQALRIPPELVMAAPISAEMFCALLTAAFAGWLSDKAGWQVPTFLGLALSFAGALASFHASSFEMFVGARALTGLGYGFAWVGIQALVVGYTAASVMTFSVANMTAAIFTGHMLGTFTGGWLADWLGFRGVFLFGAIALAFPAAYVFGFLRIYFRKPLRPLQSQSGRGVAGIAGLLRNRNFAVLLLASVIPFSIAQVSLLYYAVPIILNAAGVRTSEIGAVIALYSAIFVFLAPVIARRIDTKEQKKNFVVIGGLLGSLALCSLFVIPGLAGVVFSTALLALAASIGGAAQTSYALQLKAVRAAGIGLATGIQRSADKFGQMLGPLVIGAMYTSAGLTTALALTGAFYLLTTLTFLLIARPSSDSETATIRKSDGEV
jgi:predicted MFS family arabinose efflux permease